MIKKLKFFAGAGMVAGTLLGATSAAIAADFSFDGNIRYHNDVVVIDFSLASDATDVRVWTDSFMSATNFDPITAVWVASGSDWLKVGEDDDNDSIAPGQTWFDSGLVFATLGAGSYRFTVTPYANFAAGEKLSDPRFVYAGETPIPLSDWTQPASHYGMGTYWRVNLSGVDTATAPVPEPETYAMFLAGLGLLGAAARRRKTQA